MSKFDQKKGSDSASEDSSASDGVAPIQCIASCPICGQGLCGIRVCTGDDPTEPMPCAGFVLCDECEAMWMEPDIKSEHQYLHSESPECPICKGSLWHNSRWADHEDVVRLGWAEQVSSELSGGT